MELSLSPDLELLTLLEAERQYQLKNRDDLWYAGKLRFLCHEAQRVIYDAFYSTGSRDTVIVASRRFGKSFLGVILCLEFCIRNPYTISRFIPPEIEQAWHIVQPTFMKLEQSWPRGLIKFVASEKAWRIGNNSWLYLGGFDSQFDSQRGGEASFIVCDEGGFTVSERYNYILRSVLKPQLLDTSGRMLHLSTVPPDDTHPFLEETVVKAQLENRYHEFTIYDNPRLTQEQIDEAKRDCGGETTVEWKREYLCQRIRDADTMVLPAWDEGASVGEFPLPKHAYACVVGDFGGVRDKTVLIFLLYVYESPTTGYYLVWDEAAFDCNSSTEDIVIALRKLLSWYAHLDKYPDQNKVPILDCPGQIQVDLNKQHGMGIRMPLKDDFDAGNAMLHLLTLKNRIRIHSRCVFMAMTAKTAKFNPKRTDWLRSCALGHCDGLAALIYGIRSLPSHTDPVPPVVYSPDDYYTPKPQQNDYQKLAQLFEGKLS